MDFDQILGEACFVTNALLTVNNCTPYNAVYGRVPHILPSIDQGDVINENSLDLPGLIRHTFRLREIAVQAMIEETAYVRAQRALQTRSVPTAWPGQLKPGDLVDFFRPGGSKDLSGWTGPARVIDPTHTGEGTITIKHVHRPIEVRIGDLRPHISLLVFSAAIMSALARQIATWHTIRAFIESNCKSGTPLLLGWVGSDRCQPKLTPQSKPHFSFVKSALMFAANSLKLSKVWAIRVGKSCSTCSKLNYVSSYTVWWYGGTTHNWFNHQTDGNINWRTVDPDNWKDIRFFQAFCGAEDIGVEDRSMDKED